jgi:hypothetical protein
MLPPMGGGGVLAGVVGGVLVGLAAVAVAVAVALAVAEEAEVGVGVIVEEGAGEARDKAGFPFQPEKP